MSVIVILIVFSVLVATGFLAAFIWAVKGGQYDDTTSPAVRILDNDKIEKKHQASNPKSLINPKKEIQNTKSGTLK